MQIEKFASDTKCSREKDSFCSFDLLKYCSVLLEISLPERPWDRREAGAGTGVGLLSLKAAVIIEVDF